MYVQYIFLWLQRQQTVKLMLILHFWHHKLHENVIFNVIFIGAATSGTSNCIRIKITQIFVQYLILWILDAPENDFNVKITIS